MGSARWPDTLWLVRHGQSAGNVADDAAHAAEAALVAVVGRDADVPLSALGERQSRALGRWFSRMAPGERPTAILTSPYARACQTAASVSEALGGQIELISDERLRERELGSFDGLTRRGWTERHPEQAELRARLGKFYHRPPGGESWCDVVLRLRTLVQDLRASHAGARLLIVSHQVVVLCSRYILESMDEAAILRIDREAGVPNCAVTSYTATDGRAGSGLHPVLENFVPELVRGDAGHVRVATSIGNSGGAGEVKVTARLRDRKTGRTFLAGRSFDFDAHETIMVIVDVPAPPGDYIATVTAGFPPE